MTTKRQAERIFAQELQVFIQTFPDVRGTTFTIADEHFLEAPEERDLAWFEPDERRVVVIRRALKRSPGVIRGLIRHELGHASAGDQEHTEHYADALAEYATGSPVRYTRDGVQHATHGTVGRPTWLSE